MALAREALPQLNGITCLTDGGLETHLIFNEGQTLPQNAAFVLNQTEDGREVMRNYYRAYLPHAKSSGMPFILDTNTWRTNPDWAALLGYDAKGMKAANELAVKIAQEVAAEFNAAGVKTLISGAMGPRRDAWTYDEAMTVDEAYAYHTPQIEAFAGVSTDYVTCMTLTNAPEAIGVAKAAEKVGIQAILSFTVETDGNLPGGRPLRDVIAETDDATGGYAVFYMINCAHTSHFERLVERPESWLDRVQGIRSNASMKSHAELDESPTLDPGDPEDLARRYRRLLDLMPQVRVIGGCCGTDHRHIGAICAHLGHHH
jgi:homocysteine S-methyltransferase